MTKTISKEKETKPKTERKEKLIAVIRVRGLINLNHGQKRTFA
jgi:hypothetical protein